MCKTCQVAAVTTSLQAFRCKLQVRTLFQQRVRHRSCGSSHGCISSAC